MEMGRAYSRHRMYDKYVKNSGKPDGKTQLGRRMGKELNNSILSSKETGHVGVARTKLAYNENKVAGS
jgi:hypothetical protein